MSFQKRKIACIKSAISHQGGLEKYTIRVANHLAHIGHDVTLLTTDCEKANFSFNTVSLGKKSKSSFLHLVRFDRACQKWLQEHPQDVVFGFDRNFCLQTHYRAGNGCHAAYLQHRRAFSSFLKQITFWMNPQHRLILEMERKTFTNKELHTLFTNSNMVKEEILQHYPEVPENKIAVVHNGINWHEMEASFQKTFSERTDSCRGLGLDPNKFQFLFIGHEYNRKGLRVLLEALSLCKEKQFQLAVVGKEKRIAEYQMLAKQLGLEGNVGFFGSQSSVNTFYQVADCLVVPSYYDPFANVTLEALAMGVRVVSSCFNGASEIITDHKMGSVCQKLHPEILSLHLNEALQMPKTYESASYVRSQVQHLDIEKQIAKLALAL